MMEDWVEVLLHFHLGTQRPIAGYDHKLEACMKKAQEVWKLTGKKIFRMIKRKTNDHRIFMIQSMFEYSLFFCCFFLKN